MSLSALLFLLASAGGLLSERVFATNDMLHWPLLALSGLLFLMALGSRASSLRRHPKATRLALFFYALAGTSVLFYILQLRDTVDALGLTGDTAEHFRVAMQCAMPLFWLIGALPALGLDGTLNASPHSVHPLRLRMALDGGLGVAFGIAMLFPINYLANENNQRFDFGFFKTTGVGTATRNLVENLNEPMRAVLFFDPASEVLGEVRPYFDDISGPNLTVEEMDQAMNPEEAKQWKVKDNGNVVLIRGEGDDERSEVIKLGTDITAARKELRKLDSKVQTSMLKLARNKRTAYFTVGHDELYWKNAKDESENIDLLKKGIEGLNFKVKELGADDGLAVSVPDDAAVVFITGPKRPFSPEEIKSLQDYRDRGGSLFIMMEQGDYPDPELAALAGASFDAGPLCSDKAYAKVSGGPTDKAYIITNKFSSHESITDLGKNAAQLPMVLVNAGGVKELPQHAGKYSTTVKGMTDWWSDTNGNYDFDKDAEKRGGFEVAGVATGPATGEGDKSEWRVAIVGDASWASNLVIRQFAANQIYLSETLAWLTKDPALGGQVENEEDVKIQHTKEGEAVWFYGTSALVPALVLAAGALRVRSRRQKGAA